MNVLPLLLSIAGCMFTLYTNKALIVIPTDTSFHFSLITVNALFGGFLYTNYSLLIGLLDNSIIKKVKNTNIIQKRNFHILKGIVFATISVVAGLYLVLIPSTESTILNIINRFMLNVEIVFMAFLILYFLFSLREMSILIKSISHSKNKRTGDEIEKLKQQVRQDKDE